MKIPDIFKGLTDLGWARKLTVQFSEAATKLIEKDAKKRGIDKLELIKIAMTLYHYISEEVMEKKGLKLSITTEDSKIITDFNFDEK